MEINGYQLIRPIICQNYSCKSNGTLNTTLQNCCCKKTACSIGTFQSILFVMKDSLRSPHVFDHFWSRPIYNDETKKEFFAIPLTLTTAFQGMNVTFKNDLESIKNLQPYVPFCWLYTKIYNDQPPWGTEFRTGKYLDRINFCTLFRPGSHLSFYENKSNVIN